MNVSELRNSTAIDKALEITAVSAPLKANPKDNHGDHTQADKPVQEFIPRAELTPNRVSTYLQDISATSCTEIDALISGLRALREKLEADGSRIERAVVEFAILNQSIIKLTEVIVDSVTHVRAPSRGE